jgi:hypothetical protein
MLWRSRLDFCVYALVFFASCTSNEQACGPDPEFVVNIMVSHPCEPTGTVELDVNGQSGLLFRLNNGSPQSSPIFQRVSTGNQKIFIVNDGCEFTKVITVDTIQYGIKFKTTADILKKNCAQCHSGVNPHAGLDFTSACDILNHWQRIEERAIVGNPAPMPPGGLISLEERSKIMAWIRAGHNYEN